MEDLQSASKLLLKALKMRERYMRQSRQKFPNLVDGYIRGSGGSAAKGLDAGVPNKATIEGEPLKFYLNVSILSVHNARCRKTARNDQIKRKIAGAYNVHFRHLY